jgi:hypothetical protein
MELNNESFYDFSERCAWHYIQSFNNEHICTRGCHGKFSCAEFYCPRIIKNTNKQNEQTKIIL